MDVVENCCLLVYAFMLLISVWIKYFLYDLLIHLSFLRLLFILVNVAIKFHGATHSSVFIERFIFARLWRQYFTNVHSARKSLKILPLKRSQRHGLLHSQEKNKEERVMYWSALVICPCHPSRSVVFLLVLIQEPDLTLSIICWLSTVQNWLNKKIYIYI